MLGAWQPERRHRSLPPFYGHLQARFLFPSARSAQSVDAPTSSPPKGLLIPYAVHREEVRGSAAGGQFHKHIRTMTDKQPPPNEQPTHCARLSPYGRPAFIEREPDRDSERMEAQREGRLMPKARVNFKG